MLCLSDLVLSLVTLVAAREDVLSIVRAEPVLQEFQWSSLERASYTPFVFLIAHTKEPSEQYAKQVEGAFAPPLEVLMQSWKTDWVSAHRLQLRESSPVLALAILPDSKSFRRYVAKKLGREPEMPPATLLVNGILVTYHLGDGEGMIARRHAVLEAAAEQLLGVYLPGGDATHSAWLMMGLAAQLSELYQQSGGRRGYVWTLREITYWRDDLPRLAQSLTELQVALPSFEEILQFESVAEIEEKGASLAAGDASPARVAGLYRQYVRLCAYSLLLSFENQSGDRAKRFLELVQAEFRGDGGFAAFKARFDPATIEKEWDAFCTGQSRPSAGKAAPAPAARVAGVGSQPSASLPPEVPLDLQPRSLVELRAEMIRKIRGRQLAAAAALLEDPTLQKLGGAGELAAMKSLLEAPANLYRVFGKQSKAGDKLGTKFGVTGEVVQVSGDGFQLKQKNETVFRPWTDLDLPAVASHLLQNVKYNDGPAMLELSTSLMLCGDFAKAKNYLQQATKKGAAQDQVDRLKKMLPEFESAAREATTRDEIEKLAKLEGPAFREGLVKTSKDLRASAAWQQAEPHLRGKVAPLIAKEFEADPVPKLFRSKATVQPDQTVKLSYAFADAAELEDFPVTSYPALDEWLEKKPGARAGEWICEKGGLLVKPTGCRVHVGRFVGDVAIEFTIRVEENAEATAGPSECLAGLCDDGKGHFATIWGLIQVLVQAEQGIHHSSGSDAIAIGRDYRLKLARVGQSFQGFRDELEIGQVTAPPMRGDRIFLSAIGGYSYRIEDLVITGTLDPAWIAAQKTMKTNAVVDALFAGSR